MLTTTKLFNASWTCNKVIRLGLQLWRNRPFTTCALFPACLCLGKINRCCDSPNSIRVTSQCLCFRFHGPFLAIADHKKLPEQKLDGLVGNAVRTFFSELSHCTAAKLRSGFIDLMRDFTVSVYWARAYRGPIGRIKGDETRRRSARDPIDSN